jgi:hypothetical protein
MIGQDDASYLYGRIEDFPLFVYYPSTLLNLLLLERISMPRKGPSYQRALPWRSGPLTLGGIPDQKIPHHLRRLYSLLRSMLG